MNDVLIYLVAIVVVVPLAKRFGLGAVLGYLIAGALIGPNGFSLLQSAHERTSALAELGVIMMLLLIGLELNPKLLWKMRGPILGLGGLQVLVTTLIFAAIAVALGHSWKAGIALGLIASPSSTAIVMQTLKEKGYAKSLGGERAFAVLLFQDMAVIPMLALLPLLGSQPTTPAEANRGPWFQALLICGSLLAVLIVGRFLVRPAFHFVARLKLRETFTALALLIVIAAAALMHSVGLSPALGAFLAGVLLADSEFRHQIETDIEPFESLLLGLFFVTIGASIRFDKIIENPLPVAAWVGALVGLKALIVYALGRASKIAAPESLLLGASLAQGGEFAFVLLGQATGILDPEVAQTLTASIALSMALAPLVITFTINHGLSRLDCQTPTPERQPDEIGNESKDNEIIVIGVGRFGQTLIRFLRANGIRSTVLDMDSEQIEIMAKFGIKSYFGDGSRLDLLRAAGIEEAKALVIAIDEPETTDKIIAEVMKEYPKLPIYTRVYDRLQAYRLLKAGVTEIAVETSGSALALGSEILKRFGHSKDSAIQKMNLFREKNDQSIRTLSQHFNESDRESFIALSKQASEQLEALFKEDATGKVTPLERV